MFFHILAAMLKSFRTFCNAKL